MSFEQKLQRLKDNRWFEFFVISVILLSALEIGLKTYDLSETTLFIMSYLDVSITLFFLVEILIRFFAEPNKRQFFKNGWNVFDSLVVAISLIPVDEASMALLARLVRVFRVLRLISVVSELRMLINSLLQALPQLGYVMLLMFIIFYIYAAVGSYVFEAINPVLWGDVAVAMLTLFRVMTFEDWTDVMYETMEVYPLSWVYYLTFIFLSAFAFLNMVIGIVVNVIEDEHRKEREKHLPEEPTMTELQTQIRELKALLEATNKTK
jgi:voltage-gated sodium channel